MTIELEPHEQLDEIDRRTNSDGTVQVRLLEWEKEDGRVNVTFRTPIGDEWVESMRWPESRSDEYKFIRLIDATPYSLMTAESINEDDDLWLSAQRDNGKWSLHLPNTPSKKERLTKAMDNNDWSTETVLFPLGWPLFPILLAMAEIDHLMSKGLRDSYRLSPYENSNSRNIILAHFKGMLYTVMWIGVFIILFA